MTEASGEQGAAAEEPAPGPALSVVVVCASGWRNLRGTLAALASQTIAPRIELLAVAPDEPGPEAARLFACLGSVRTFQVPTIRKVDEEAAAVILGARAPVVASLEDHAFPEPEWAEAVLRPFANDPSCVAVGSALMAANPASRLGTGNMLVAFTRWSEAAPAGPIPWLQLHNIAYRRNALAALASEAGELPPLFNRESEVVLRLRERGTLHFAPAARIRHLNPSRLRSVASIRLHAGRLDAASRAAREGWGPVRRLLYGLASPLIPLLRYARLRRLALGRPGISERRHGPGMVAVLAFDGLGQGVGFLSGPGAARERLAQAEHDRYGDLSRRDAADFGSP